MNNATLLDLTPTLVLAEAGAVIAWLPAVTMVAGVLVMGVILALSFNRKERQLRALAAEINNDLEEARSLRTQLDEAHATASSMMVSAQRLSARLDERIAALDLASLRMSATRNALPRVAASPLAHEPHQRMAKSAGQPDAMAQATSAAVPHAEAGGLAAVAVGAAVEMKPTVDSFTRRVYELADAGHEHIDIARELNEHVGKIDLILALR